jgi:hypothetical protein
MDDFLLICCFNAVHKGLKFGEMTLRYAQCKRVHVGGVYIRGSRFLGFFGFSICNIKIQTAKRILRSNYKRHFSIFLALPMGKWYFCAKKSEKGTK